MFKFSFLLFFCAIISIQTYAQDDDVNLIYYGSTVRTDIVDIKRGKQIRFVVTDRTGSITTIKFDAASFKRKLAIPNILSNLITSTTKEPANANITKTETVRIFPSKKFKIKGDFTTLKLTFLSESDTTEETIEFYSKQYWRVGISTGLFGSNLVNPSYYYADTSTLNKNIQKEKKTSVDVAIGALFHVQYVVTSRFKIGPTIGMGISIFDAKTKYLAGLAITYGRKDELTLSFGWAGSNLAELSSSAHSPSYKVDVTKAPPTVDKFNSGVFVGLSYSLFNR